MNKLPEAETHDDLRVYGASEPRRTRDPFADRRLRAEISRIAAARADRAASGWRSAIASWLGAAPRGAIAGAALSVALLLGTGLLQVVEHRGLAARLEAGSAPLESSLVPQASTDVMAEGVSGDSAEEDEIPGGTVVTTAALLLLSGSVTVAFITVRRRRA